MDKYFHATLFNGCIYLCILELRLIHVSTKGYYSWLVYTLDIIRNYVQPGHSHEWVMECPHNNPATKWDSLGIHIITLDCWVLHGSTQKNMVWHKKTWFDTKIPSSARFSGCYWWQPPGVENNSLGCVTVPRWAQHPSSMACTTVHELRAVRKLLKWTG